MCVGELAQELMGAKQRSHRRRVHEIKAQHVIDAHRFELQDRAGKVAALDLWRGQCGQSPVSGFSVQAICVAGSFTTCGA